MIMRIDYNGPLTPDPDDPEKFLIWEPIVGRFFPAQTDENGQNYYDIESPEPYRDMPIEYKAQDAGFPIPVVPPVSSVEPYAIRVTRRDAAYFALLLIRHEIPFSIDYKEPMARITVPAEHRNMGIHTFLDGQKELRNISNFLQGPSPHLYVEFVRAGADLIPKRD